MIYLSYAIIRHRCGVFIHSEGDDLSGFLFSTIVGVVNRL
jgi:hypothetical protein